ncbi:MAG: hypothetical protein GY754_15720 [bacterium]|nr:hypothetical protein [bacterium]
MNNFLKSVLQCSFIFILCFSFFGKAVFGAKITLTGKPEVELVIKDLSANEQKAFIKKENLERLYVKYRTGWAKKSLKVEEHKWGGVAVKLHAASDDPDIAVKKEAIRIALEMVQAKGFKFPGNNIEFFCHSYKKSCVGFLLPMLQSSKGVIVLGTNALHVEKEIVATKIYDQHKARSESDAKLKQATTAVLHEMGHIFHQYAALSYYTALVNLKKLTKLNESAYTQLLGSSSDYKKMYASFTSKPTYKQLKDAMGRIDETSAEVSAYANEHPNEFIAEVFSGLMMGINYSDDIVDIYHALGGPGIP